MIRLPAALPLLGAVPIDGPQAVIEQANDFFGDLNDAEILLEYARFDSPPYVLAGAGLAIAVLCGLTFAKLVQNRLEAWKQDRLPLLPLAARPALIPLEA